MLQWPFSSAQGWPSIDYATNLLRYFVQQGIILYGSGFMVYNVHCLLHIPTDVKAFGSVDAFSAFPFESFLYRLKRMMRSGMSPLVQIIKRIDEMERHSTIHSNHELTIMAQSPTNENNKSKIMCRVFDNVQPLSAM